jgi:hypothetical protein
MPTRDPEKRRAALKRYSEKHAAEIRERARQWREANPDAVAKYDSSPDRVQSRRIRDKVRDAKRRDGRKPYIKSYKQREAEAVRVKNREWRGENAERINAERRARWQRDPTFRLSIVLRSRLYDALKGKRRSGSAVRNLGCTLEQAVAHIERQFQSGMTWDNWGKWHIDHIRPMCSFDLTVPEQLAVACHYTNLRPLWAADNLRKGGKPHQEPTEATPAVLAVAQ